MGTAVEASEEAAAFCAKSVGRPALRRPGEKNLILDILEVFICLSFFLCFVCSADCGGDASSRPSS